MSTLKRTESLLEVVTPDQPTPDDFDNYLPWAVVQLEGDFNLVITRAFQAQYESVTAKDRKKHKLRSKIVTEQFTRSGILSPDAESDTSKDLIVKDENTFIIETTYNDANNLVALKFFKNKTIPRLVFQILKLVIPFHSALSSVVINQGLNAESIYEISKYYESTNRITELILDNCYVPEANYHILLDNVILKHLSLSRCNITDTVVKIIASKLTNPAPAAKSLSVLNLSINKITNIGIKHLEEMLRINRQLSYLNLAHNVITDEGAISILDILKTFVLTKEECKERSRKLISYFNRKSEMIMQTVQELHSAELEKKLKKKSSRAASVKHKPERESVPAIETLESICVDKAEVIVKGILGEFKDTFDDTETFVRGRERYCLGNYTLRYLNFAYNNLTYTSVRKINEVIEFQKSSGRKLGLVNIRIEGNLVPRSCKEYGSIDQLLITGLTKKCNVEVSKKKTVLKH